MLIETRRRRGFRTVALPDCLVLIVVMVTLLLLLLLASTCSNQILHISGVILFPIFLFSAVTFCLSFFTSILETANALPSPPVRPAVFERPPPASS
jgi:hypothetical protein